ncbi:hypothetical protein ACFFKC_20960 [Pseudoduganella danionis]|nr:hypothetical protein [Pseudoduganella danionis]
MVLVGEEATLGRLGTWALIDFIVLILGNFADSDDLKIKGD